MAEDTALTHQPVFYAEAVGAALAAMPGAGDTVVDATFGGGGHSRALLEKLPADCRLLALDCDEFAAARAAAIKKPNFTFVRRNFAALSEVLAALDIGGVRAVLFDLGVSSLQLDAPTRGFSFRYDSALDMRLDRRDGETAMQWLQNNDEAAICAALKNYGEEPEARRVARVLFARRADLMTTAALVDAVTAAKKRPTPGKHPATRVFQALRIAVNQELENLQKGLDAAVRALLVGGRLVVIAFHSLEDRIVKRLTAGATFPGWGRMAGYPLRPVGRMQRPSVAEVAANPRARSARLRVFTKTEGLA